MATSNATEVSDNKREEEEYSSRSFMTQIDDILLEGEAEEAAAKPLRVVSSSLNVEAKDSQEKSDNKQQEDVTDESFDSGIADEMLAQLPKELLIEDSPSPSPKQRAVKFSGMDEPTPTWLEEASRTQLIEKLGGLQERLAQTQVDLKNEKSSRRKKDKNIIKMAQELSKRQIDAAEKEKTIADKDQKITEKERKIAELNQLLMDMEAKLTKSSELEEELRSKTVEYEKKLANRATEEEMQSRIAGYGEKVSNATMTSGSPLKESTNAATLSDTLDHNQVRSVPTEEAKPQKVQLKGFSNTVWALSLCLVVFVSMVYSLSPNGVCAPVMPGTVLTGGDFSSSAPWWAPESVKEPTFQFLCGGRARVHVEVEGGKLYLRQEQNGKMTTLQKARAVNATIDGASITLESKSKANKKIIPAPWAR